MTIPVTPLAAARYLCEKSGWSLSNLKLQKIMYLIQMLYLGQRDSRLIDGSFEAWDYGPVMPDVYSCVRVYGGDPIKNIFHGVEKITDAKATYIFDQALERFGKYSPGQLVEMTHWPKGAWAACYKPGAYGIPIPDGLIKEEYEKRVRVRTDA